MLDVKCQVLNMNVNLQIAEYEMQNENVNVNLNYIACKMLHTVCKSTHCE